VKAGKCFFCSEIDLARVLVGRLAVFLIREEKRKVFHNIRRAVKVLNLAGLQSTN
jgi:hypothetical protein